MARVIDIDDLIDLDKVVVKIGGESYTLPGDIPIPDYLALRRAFNQLADPADGDDSDPDEVLEDLADQLLVMFKVHQPAMDALPFGPKTVVPIVFAYLNQNMGETVDDEAPPTRRRASTPKKSSGKPRSRTTTQSR